jgi:tetratricopeptide (TPR) repeat protein
MKLRFQLLVSLSFLLLMSGAAVVFAQDPVQPPEGVTWDSDWLYGKHLEQVNAIMKEPDLAVRVQKLETFTKKLNPKAKILPYMESFFLQTMEEYTKAGKTQEANAVFAKVIELFPDSPTVKAYQFRTAFQNKDYAKTIQLGEELNAANPDPQIMAILIQAYIGAKDLPKAAEYSQKMLDTAGPKQGVAYLLWLAEYAQSQKDTAKALEYYNKFLETFPEVEPPQGWAPQTWNQNKTTAYMLRARQASEQKDYAGTIKNATEALKFSPNNATAYLMIGLAHWQLQELDKAEEAFAKATVLGGPASARAREYLDQIWKPRHNGTTDGLDAFLAKAKADLKL